MDTFVDCYETMKTTYKIERICNKCGWTYGYTTIVNNGIKPLICAPIFCQNCNNPIPLTNCDISLSV